MVRCLILWGWSLLFSGVQMARGDQCLKPNYMMAWTELPPYMMKNPQGKVVGLDIRFIKAVFKQLNCPLTLVQLPWKRSLYEVQKGRVDFLGLASRVAEREQFAYYSTAYRLEQIRIAVRRGEVKRWEIAKLEDLIGLNMRLNVQLGAWYGPAYAKAIQQKKFKALVYADIDNDKQMFRLLNNRADGVVQDVVYFDYFTTIHDKKGQVELLPFVVHNNPVHFIFSKASIAQADFTKINGAIKKVKRTPLYQQLYKKSGVVDIEAKQ
ncbi:substrate-binding periplasmic protein [Spartinivicinus ruber]|uniref:substrate-binding periplasmic protein n=1 Tax=Spartinivicinus ruber TaxID=2683272 RepID=UPI0013D414C4|nr:transporter substrate-binding domain-containing protein [Spartinivicinus ruber]